MLDARATSTDVSTGTRNCPPGHIDSPAAFWAERGRFIGLFWGQVRNRFAQFAREPGFRPDADAFLSFFHLTSVGLPVQVRITPIRRFLLFVHCMRLFIQIRVLHLFSWCRLFSTQDAASLHRCAHGSPNESIEPMVVAPLRTQPPFVHRPAPSCCRYSILGGEVFGELGLCRHD